MLGDTYHGTTKAPFLSMYEQGLNQWKKLLKYNIFSHWLRPCLTIERKWALVHSKYDINYYYCYCCGCNDRHSFLTAAEHMIHGMEYELQTNIYFSWKPFSS